jgi:SAM-dependent methyltransferase
MDQRTAEFYTTRAEEWAAGKLWDWNKWLDPFLDLLAPGALILELGCGDGRDAVRMIDRGFRVEASDGVPRMAELAGRRLGREVPVMRFDELAADSVYDAVYASASLLHMPLDELPGIVARIHRALKPGGWHYASFKGGDGPGRDEHGRFFSYPPLADLAAAYRSAGAWWTLELDSRDGASFGGAPTPWHSVTARK